MASLTKPNAKQLREIASTINEEVRAQDFVSSIYKVDIGEQTLLLVGVIGLNVVRDPRSPKAAFIFGAKLEEDGPYLAYEVIRLQFASNRPHISAAFVGKIIDEAVERLAANPTRYAPSAVSGAQTGVLSPHPV
jgi:hypothetical protein